MRQSIINRSTQMSESLRVGALLALVGGFLDAYTYIIRGNVFANAQTGNIVLLGLSISNGDLKKALEYLIPISAFFIGILVAEMIKSKYKEKQGIHWRQIIIIMECFALIIVSIIPEGQNNLANAVISFVCSLQVESFRKVNGNPYATTMCTGNLRSATEQLYKYRQNGDKKVLYNSLQYFCVITFFIVGACIGTILSNLFQIRAVGFAAVLLVIVIVLINKKVD